MSESKRWPIGLYITETDSKYMEWEKYEVIFKNKFSCSKIKPAMSPDGWGKLNFKLLIPVEFL